MNSQDNLYYSTINESIRNAYSVPPLMVNKDPKYECIFCQEILMNPMQLKCGHRLCNNCYKLKIEIGVINCSNKGNNCESSTLDEVLFMFN